MLTQRKYQSCGYGYGSGWIGIILLDPDLDLHPGPANPDRDLDLYIFISIHFSTNFQYAVQNTKNYDTYDIDEKDKTMYTGIHEKKKSSKNSDFPTCVNLRQDPDLDRHKHGKSDSDPDPGRHQNDADPQHWKIYMKCKFKR
jgi:hypothetical protein